MKVRVLGSAAGGGLPQWNCGGANSRRARRRGWFARALAPRNQPSIAISAGDARWSLVNASPDLRQQFANFPGLHPKAGAREIPLDRVVLTNADLDHVLGLLIMREALPYRVVTSAWIRDALLEHNAVFRLLASTFDVVRAGESFALDAGEKLEAQLFAVPGKAPGWVAAHKANAPEATLALRVRERASGRRLVYAPGVKHFDDALLDELARADLRFVDGTFFRARELQTLRPGAPDCYAMGHAPITGDGGSLEKLRALPGRTFYIHINNSNPILDSRSAEAREVVRAGVGIAHDGLEVQV